MKSGSGFAYESMNGINQRKRKEVVVFGIMIKKSRLSGFQFMS
jgi:hypothetical protein